MNHSFKDSHPMSNTGKMGGGGEIGAEVFPSKTKLPQNGLSSARQIDNVFIR